MGRPAGAWRMTGTQLVAALALAFCVGFVGGAWWLTWAWDKAWEGE